MIYECDNCEATLGPGLTTCPHCGQVFDEPVPADALWNAPFFNALPEPDALPGENAGLIVLEAVAPGAALPEVVTTPGLKTRARRVPLSVVSLALLGLCWFGYHQWDLPPPSEAVPYSVAPRPTDLEAHPQYAANMTALLQKLRSTGVGAEWPAFGSDDVLVITPQTRTAEPPMTWDADMSRRLAQGVYGEFAQTRFGSGFPDGDTTACFVIVIGTTGQVMAVDFMGTLE